MPTPLPDDWYPPQETENLNILTEDARHYLKSVKKILPDYITGRDFAVQPLIKHYTRQTDRILTTLYQQILAGTNTALYAVGGYGRGELFPASDVDILILTSACPSAQEYQKIETFIQSIWQLGIEISHSVRSRETLSEDARQDTDILTALLEQRYLAGQNNLAVDVCVPPVIAANTYIAAKLKEQHRRDDRHEHTGRLEPNIKTDSGGLRDIQMIDWLSIYCYHDYTRQTLIEKQLLTTDENRQLTESRNALWRLRFALHLNHSGQKNTLTFEQQKHLATLFGYQDKNHSPAIEQLMHDYYRHSMRIRRINRRCIALIEANLQPMQPLIALNDDFAQKNNKLMLLRPEHLSEYPLLLWDIFIYLQEHPEIQGLHPELVRYLHTVCETLMDNHFCTDSTIRRRFLTILGRPGSVYPQLRRMHRYGLLHRYIKPFWHIVGRMQYDLFHQYTVDQHTLLVSRILDQFALTDNKDYPEAAAVMAKLPDPGILYLAALFHDIGKGYGADHSEVGAQIANLYARENDAINEKQRQLLVFLVKHHLTLSLTAQKKDLSDARVIAEFASLFPDYHYLDYLYLLTMADVSATNKSLWNHWRASLFCHLYRQARHILKHNPEELLKLQHAECRLAKSLVTGAAAPAIDTLWAQLPPAFFNGENAAVIARKTELLLGNTARHSVSQIQLSPPRLFISSPYPADILFARITHFMEKNGCNISEARLYSTCDARLNIQQYTLSDASPLSDAQLQALENYSADKQIPTPLGMRLNTSLKYFTTDTEVHISQDRQRQRTLLSLVCKDRHGLLSLISRIFLKHHIHISHAKIATFGERAEDTFYLTDPTHGAITDTALLKTLEQEIRSALK